jgi:hypothetical protein
MALSSIPAIRIPDDFTVWAGSDLHGQLAAVDRLLEAAGLTDGGDRWVAPPRTALVVTGDMVDRGSHSVGLVRRLVSLREQAPSSGGLVVLLEGNHEIQVLGGLDGEPTIFEVMMTFGGGATLLSAGLQPGEWEGLPPPAIATRVDSLTPDLRPSMWTFAPYAVWGDVLFVHAGPVPFMDLAGFQAGAERLWIREAFSASPELFPDADAWTAYREAGMGRVVFGHTSVVEPAFGHRGRTVNIDTWRGGRVTLARFEPGRDLPDATFISEASEPRAIVDAPVTAEEIRAIDAMMPGVVRAWWRSVEASRETP